MVGKGRGAVLGVRSVDPVLSLSGSLGLAASAGTALVVDLGRDVPSVSGRTLAEIQAGGPSLDELSPGRSGVAVISTGDLNIDRAHELIIELSGSWPAVVVRVANEQWSGPTVPLVPLYPGWLAPRGQDAAVWQPVGARHAPPGPGPVLPSLSSRLVRALVNGRLPVRSKWIRSWERVWGMPWA